LYNFLFKSEIKRIPKLTERTAEIDKLLQKEIKEEPLEPKSEPKAL
jgi:hypothetical protein